MGLVRSLDEISALAEHLSKGFVLGDAVVVMAMFRTEAEVVKRVLPPWNQILSQQALPTWLNFIGRILE